MAVLTPKKFHGIIVILQSFLVNAYSKGNREFCESIFETQADRVLTGHVLRTINVSHDFECPLQCLGSDNKNCMSFNIRPGNKTKYRVCEMNNSSRQLKPNDFKQEKGSIYYGSLQIPCIDVSLRRSGKTKRGHCHSGYKGKHCEKFCPTGWNLFKNNCYLFNDFAMTWLQAQTFCRGLKGELVKINSAEENKFVWDLATRQAPSVNYIRIGLKWNSTANDFYWYDHSVPVYKNWASGEPNGNASEPCGHMYGLSSPSKEQRWNDIPCNRTMGTACQRVL